MECNEYLARLIQAAKNIEGLELFADKAKLSKTEFGMLREIVFEREKGRDIISSELARRLGVTRSAISQIVAKMELQGIIERASSPVDRKIAYVRLSEKAKAIFTQQCREANELIGRVVKEYGADKMDALLNAYEEFSAVLVKVRKEMIGEAKNGEAGEL